MKILKSQSLEKSIKFFHLTVRWLSSTKVLCEQKMEKPIDVNFIMIVQLNSIEAAKLGLISALGVIQGIKGEDHES